MHSQRIVITLVLRGKCSVIGSNMNSQRTFRFRFLIAVGTNQIFLIGFLMDISYVNLQIIFVRKDFVAIFADIGTT